MYLFALIGAIKSSSDVVTSDAHSEKPGRERKKESVRETEIMREKGEKEGGGELSIT